ncbi:MULTISPECIES: mannitol dehydrogenase family protein [Bosea]|uniref:mannitol dehydrogenase family protein n=1 Tax=Bosea TaxID=85413 RepID=UPI00214FF2CA|nr:MULTISPECIES: mannitol dehydrogenase family protein [Bosea]MCR4521608.1 mannitol dehydrogenase family protein [Bosea sp. 47.2.35]MDR6829353.1 mannitol 2-dehydrogenase [Bosea robiniae]MDR6896132.1 mannitol 2-dehydrogenase [Bosea sp. BE109]MDR7139634.1 mannitol 2-dehydrogenase [Bosea sp. BE168]MDR7176227.1 mannitol 2-dehydrogenase [Bosea sp. BE271]
MAVRLSRATLGQLGPSVGIPGYRRDDLSPGIVHIGVGNFHRAHQAAYLDELFERGLDHDWAIIGTGVRESDAEMGRDLAAQDFLTTVVTQEAGSSQARVTGAMIDFVPPGDTAAIIARLVDPHTRIASLTVTEGGYYIDPATQAFDPSHPDIVTDAVDRLAAPKTAFGLIAAGLLRRRAAGLPPFTVMSCDNLPGNGHVTADAVAGLVDLIDRNDASWIRDSVAFPNGMVDRITPATSERERQSLREDFGIADSRPVFCEGFRQWVLEDHFPAGRPRLEEVGVQFVADVAPFELMKIRILNGGHAAIAYPAGLLDIHFVHEAMQDTQIARFLSALLDDEVIPVVPPVPDTDLADYKRTIGRRFANPKIGDTIRRLCLDGSNRQPKFILPTLRDALQAGRPIEGLALVSALWCRYCYGETESRQIIQPNDPNWPRLTEQARLARNAPEAWLAMQDIYGDLGQDERFRSAFTEALQRLWQSGTRASLDHYMASRSS